MLAAQVFRPCDDVNSSRLHINSCEIQGNWHHACRLQNNIADAIYRDPMSTSQEFSPIQHAARRHLERYYTESVFSELLIGRLRRKRVETAVELGVGQGSLLTQLSTRWPNAKLLSVDLDATCRQPALSAAASHAHFRADVLSIDLPNKIGVESDFADIAVCNPPFAFARWRKAFPDILKRVGLPTPEHSISFAADILFLAQNLWMLKSGGELGIIVPAGLINGAKNRRVRDALITRHSITEVVELPANAFSGVEVRSFIIYLKKNRAPGQSIRLLRCDCDGAIDDPIQISTDQGSVRLDYSYYSWESLNRSAAAPKVSDKLIVIRGNIGKLEAQSNNWPIVHTTDIGRLCSHRRLHLPKSHFPKALLKSKVTAIEGDVLLARVGRDLQEKMVYVASGTAVVSDCVFVLRSATLSKSQLWKSLSSKPGREWIRVHSHGACAQFISKSDLERFPARKFSRT